MSYNYNGMQTIELTETFGQRDSIKPKWHMNQTEFENILEELIGDKQNEQSKPIA